MLSRRLWMIVSASATIRLNRMSGQDTPRGSDPLNAEDEDDLAAAEHVLGLTDSRARALAAAPLAADPDFAAAVADWERRFEPLFDAAAPSPPPADLWARIAAITDPGGHVVALSARRPLWDRVGLWRMATGASLSAAVASLWILIGRPAPRPALGDRSHRRQAPGPGRHTGRGDGRRRRLQGHPGGRPGTGRRITHRRAHRPGGGDRRAGDASGRRLGAARSARPRGQTLDGDVHPVTVRQADLDHLAVDVISIAHR